MTPERLGPLAWFGLPPQAAAWLALLLGLCLLWPDVGARAVARIPERLRLPLLCGLGAALSWLYFEGQLGGRPRIIDASTYLLEARTFASWHFTFAVPEPSALFRGRFLLPTVDEAGGIRLGPIFPPGYPAVLALGVWLGDYRMVGPCLAAAATAATAWLALGVSADKRIAGLAALFAVLSAAARYHTADTMSHGLSLTLTALALGATVRCARGERPAKERARLQLLLGFLLGSLIATRQLTGLAIAAACGLGLGLGRRVRLADCLWLALGAAGPLAFLALHNHALTGHFFGSPQLTYYERADGPPGCFRLGLGSGCQFEHGDVVHAQGDHGLTLLWMLQNTLHRFHWHLLDVANCELLTPLAYWFLLENWRSRSVRPLLAAALLLPFAYAFFYFQGSYPGGGARFFIELLPPLHVGLAALLLRGPSAERRAATGVALSLLGYALHASLVHQAVPQAPPSMTVPGPDGIPRVTTDHAFNLLFLPGRVEQGLPPSVARWNSDARRVAPASSARAAEPFLLEAELDFPLLGQQDLTAYPAFVSDPCVSAGRALRLQLPPGADPAGAWIDLELAGLPPGTYDVQARLWREPGSEEGSREAATSEENSPEEQRCTQVPLGRREIPSLARVRAADLSLTAKSSLIFLDALEVRRTAETSASATPRKKR